MRRLSSHLHPPGSFALADHPVPGGREEVWRFTPVARLASLWELAGPVDGSGVRVEVAAPDAVATGELTVEQAPRGTVLTPVDRPAALAALAPTATHVRIPAGECLGQPVRITVVGGPAPAESSPAESAAKSSPAAPTRAQATLAAGAPLAPTASEPTPAPPLAARHLVIEAGAGSRATVVIHHAGAARFLGNVEIVVGDRAELTVVSLQDWDANAWHFGQHEAKVGRDARFRHIACSLGGDLIRLTTNVSYAGPGGRAELFGVYFADAGQHIEHRLFVDHNHPQGTSLVDYRGALQGRGARSVWVGDVVIRPEATGVDTYESNRNLVLTDGCRADAVPNLEIETGEIAGAGHSASVGRFDDEHLFYLRSRGIAEAEARRLVVRGFFAQLIGRIGLADVEAALVAAIERELARSDDPVKENL